MLCTINSISTSDLDSMESLVELYSGAGQQPSTSGDDRYFGKHGTIQFEQVSTLNSMALAKTGDRLATRLRLKLATLQVILPCPPPNAPSTRKNKESIMFPNCYRQCFPSSVEGFNDREYSECRARGGAGAGGLQPPHLFGNFKELLRKRCFSPSTLSYYSAPPPPPPPPPLSK